MNFRNHALEAFLEITAVLGARDQRTHVERVNRAVLQHFRNALLRDHARQAFGQRRLSHTRLTDVQRVVLASAAKDLHGALNFQLTADQRINFAFDGSLIKIGCILLERRRLGFRLGLHLRLAVFGALAGDLRHPM